MRRGSFFLGVLLTVSFSGACGLGGGSEEARTVTVEQTAQEKAPSEPRPAPGQGGSSASRSGGAQKLAVGEGVDVGSVRATLNDVRLLPETDLDQTQVSGGEFLAADLTFENTSDEPVSVSSLLEFVLKDEDGYSASQTIHTGQRQLSEGEIAPGQKTSGEIVYEVPPDAQQGLQLDYNPVEGDIHTWDVGDTNDLSRPTVASAPEGAPSSPPAEPDYDGADAQLRQAVRNYYRAADGSDWAYTYDNLDYQTRTQFTREEWYQKNQWYADNGTGVTTSPNVDVAVSPSGTEADVTVYRILGDGTPLTKETVFVLEGGVWKHRFIGEELELFMPGTSYEEFVASQGGEAPSPPAEPDYDDESEAEVDRAVRYYYEAADREDWAYTYDNLDYDTRSLFTDEDEWYQKNQWLADNQAAELVSVTSDVGLSPSGTEADVTVYRTFSDGSTQERETVFVREVSLWKHRLVGEEIDLFMPGVPFEDFVAAQ